MSLNIQFTAGGSSLYGKVGRAGSTINKNSRQYKAAAKDFLAAHRAEVAKMTPEEKMIYELFGGEDAYMRNVMKNYNSDGDFVGPGGIIVPGMVVNGIPESERHQMISVSEEHRQKMFDMVKKSSSGRRELQTGIPQTVPPCSRNISSVFPKKTG